ncbi:hypothetical protein TTMY_1842 [Thermus thermophilus]|nr:hypothetical protein TTMY_1842 [Thermus thermophilus]
MEGEEDPGPHRPGKPGPASQAPPPARGQEEGRKPHPPRAHHQAEGEALVPGGPKGQAHQDAPEAYGQDAHEKDGGDLPPRGAHGAHFYTREAFREASK